MNDPELIGAYSGFILAIAFSIALALTPIAVVVGSYFSAKEDIAEYVRELAERTRKLEDRLNNGNND